MRSKGSCSELEPAGQNLVGGFAVLCATKSMPKRVVAAGWVLLVGWQKNAFVQCL